LKLKNVNTKDSVAYVRRNIISALWQSNKKYDTM